MRDLVIMPTENRERMNLGEFAEEATIIVEETAKPSITLRQTPKKLPCNI